MILGGWRAESGQQDRAVGGGEGGWRVEHVDGRGEGCYCPQCIVEF